MGFNEVGEVIKQRRKALNLSQAQLAAMAGLSVNTLYIIERGEGNPTLEILLKITEVLGMEVNVDVKKRI